MCDLAETYGVLDMDALPARLVATLAAGLREDSRIITALRKKHAQTEPTWRPVPVLKGYETEADFNTAWAAFKKGGG